jgi:F-type H+-transporting ATPase subunit b
VELDWLTVAAQIVNFLVLVWLLQHFLYAPITKAMSRREERIEERLADARKSREEAEAEAARLRDKQEELERNKEELMDEARGQADGLREKLEEELREDLDEKREAWHKRLEEERANFSEDFRKIASRHVIGTVRSILSDFAGADLAGQIAEEFIDRLEALSEDDLQKLKTAVARQDEDAVVESGVELAPSVRAKITRALHEKLHTNKEVDYRTSEDLVVGIRLILGEQTVEWSARRHLDKLEDVVEEALESDAARAKTNETKQ